MFSRKKNLSYSTYRISILLLQEKTYYLFLHKFKHSLLINHIKVNRLNSLLRTKKCIYFLRTLDYKSIETKLYRSSFYNIGYILISIIFSVLRTEENTTKEILNKANYSSSIHAALEFVEREWEFHNYFIRFNILNIYHPETIIRFLRKSIHDTLLIHLIRLYIYFSVLNKSHKNDTIKCINIQLNLLVYFLFKEEIINFFTFRFIKHRKKFFKFYEPQNIINKFNNVRYCLDYYDSLACKIIKNKNHKKKTNVLSNICFYQEFFVINVDINSMYLHNLQNCIISFLETRLGMLSCINDLDKYSFIHNILKYNIRRIKIVYLKILNDGFQIKKTYFMKNSNLFYCPNNNIYINLIKNKFIFLRKGLSKANWCVLDDKIIINRFKIIINSLLSYYRGSINKQDLFKIIYLLRYSCLRTLCYKHKTNIKLFIRDNTNDFYIFFFQNSFSKKTLLRQRIWNYKIYNISNFLQ